MRCYFKNCEDDGKTGAGDSAKQIHKMDLDETEMRKNAFAARIIHFIT